MTTTQLLSPHHALRTVSPVIGDSLQQYLAEVRRIPLLTVEEEQQLAEQLKSTGDINAAQALIMAHLRFVVHIARGYRGYGLPLSDLIQEGNIGLMKAVKRFEPEQKVRLVTFAVHWIRAEIHEYILKNWRIVKIATTKAQRKLFFKMRQMKNGLGWLTAEETRAIAAELNVPEREVATMESRLYSHDVAIDAPLYENDSEGSGPSYEQILVDQHQVSVEDMTAQRDEDDRLSAMSHALTALDARSRDILERRWLAEPKATLQTLADEYQVSAERVRQIENAALKKLKMALPAPE
ncbi:MAG: RNA polymerase factor sigma-32 [Halothiobacillus sp. 24-54-40]|jgi:RNA polymerase sigma-32 factor|nr:RNA polymerase sigma factor RpoH [Halothiobacillaceae bacterium]OYV45045.1 MAG: RNA polymerase factor sigma-32 [Halothiobacillus sp. 20-53-49]OYY33745.1 MAG: RNA polymerase factor sigma-32 [Halothiobacillus sp. 35-54-62]OYZ87822.1 MAG: RNA polymerase factor sigma-32 [Halothiobacillus sp. 24-54-40]OZA80051.1 MAG: RNA polymerase factor sigma-32 [Halothiobacillus sp. 39-53-45]HQS01986.1 RNA polymerase sigma factor RpoH [Halothiobacillus sp.]